MELSIVVFKDIQQNSIIKKFIGSPCLPFANSQVYDLNSITKYQDWIPNIIQCVQYVDKLAWYIFYYLISFKNASRMIDKE